MRLIIGLHNTKQTKLTAILDKEALTEREIEVLRQICLGKTNKEIGVILKISARTVHFHRGNLYEKTKAENPYALALYAIKHGIVFFG